MSGFSLRGSKPGAKGSGPPEPRALLDSGGLNLNPLGADPNARLDFLQGIVDAFEGSDDVHCRALRRRILDVLRGLHDALSAAKAGNQKQVRGLALKAERALRELEPETLESCYYLAHQYLSRHKHAHPAGSEHALAPTVVEAVERYAKACRELGRALRSGRTEAVKSSHSKWVASSQSVAEALADSPPVDIGPAK